MHCKQAASIILTLSIVPYGVQYGVQASVQTSVPYSVQYGVRCTNQCELLCQVVNIAQQHQSSSDVPYMMFSVIHEGLIVRVESLDHIRMHGMTTRTPHVHLVDRYNSTDNLNTAILVS